MWVRKRLYEGLKDWFEKISHRGKTGSCMVGCCFGLSAAAQQGSAAALGVWQMGRLSV